MDEPNGWYVRPAARSWRCDRPPSAPHELHRSIPGYRPTPLVECPALADELSVGAVYVKDESRRFDLAAFKILGASWAVDRAIRARTANTTAPTTLESLALLTSELGRVKLTTATDGNHGRAVARMARLIGAAARIYVPAGIDPTTVPRIESEGASVIEVADSYDATVERAAAAADHDATALLIQDTAWPGYERVPQWTVDGYSTLFREIDSQLHERGAAPVGLLTVPSGVGSLAQAAVAYHRSGDATPPALLSVEPDGAACIRESLRNAERVSVSTGTTTMDGLNCGTPSSIAWPYLRDGMDAAISVSDAQSTLARTMLAASGVPAGPCGASSLAALRAAVAGRDGDLHREQVGLTSASTVVLLSTDGDPAGT